MTIYRVIFIILSCFLFVVSIEAQTQKLLGYVFDSINQTPIPYANVYEIKNKKGVSSDINGYFELTLKKQDNLNVEITHIEFKKKNYYLNTLNDTVLTVILQPKTINLEDVVVIGNTGIKNSSNIYFNQKQISAIPALIGEKDIIKALQFSPGVQGGNEGTVGFSVRGGGEDQNLYLIDNMPIYSPSHLLGFFSTFNPDIIQQTELVRAGMPANYGGKLSSVVNIKTRKPSYKELKGSYSLGLVSAKVFAEIPVVKNKSGLMISGRRSYFDKLTTLQAKLSDSDDFKKIGFYDMNIKYEHSFNKNDIFSIQHIRNHDFYFNLFGKPSSNFKDKSGIEWSGNASFFNYKHIAKSNGVFSVLAGINNYSYSYLNENYNGAGKLENGYKKTSSIRDYLSKLEWSDYFNDKINYIVGFSHTLHNTVPQNLLIMDEEQIKVNEYSNEIAIFAHLNFSLKNNDIISIGLRQNIYLNDSVADFPLEPRLSYIKDIKDFGSLKTSFSRNIQFIHRVEDFSTGLPTEMWYLTNNDLKYQENYQISLELNHRINSLKLDVGAAIYYKWMNNLVEYGNYYADLPLPSIFNNRIIEGGGKGKAYGLEIFCNKHIGKLNYSISYLLSKSIRKFENFNSANWYSSNTDRLHNFNTTISYKFNEKVSFSLAWLFSTGKPITVPEGRYYSNNKEVSTLYYIGNRNNYRLADYHRLDASIQFKKIKRKGTSTFEFGLYNAYNRSNPYSIDFEDEMILKNGTFVRTGKVKIKQYSLFPIVPSISYIRNL